MKYLSNEYGTACVRAAYQAHGAIGLTREYALQRLARRLLVWRDEDGLGPASVGPAGGRGRGSADLMAVASRHTGRE